ncbi:MAG: DUF3488 and transglutaminase-like domain-containing protein [Mariprofundaceae bacterium]
MNLPNSTPTLFIDLAAQAERLTLGILLSGIAALALSDFVSPVYWIVVFTVALLRFTLGMRFSLNELQASMVGWLGFFWVGLELFLGRDVLVAFTDFMLILSLAVIVEEATPRNHLHRLIVGTFLVLAAAVLTDSVLYAIPLATWLLFMWRGGRQLYGMQQPGGDLRLGQWRKDLNIIFYMLLATGVLFVTLPRIHLGSTFQNVQRHMETTGFSNMIELGDFARDLDTSVVMRIEGVDMHGAKLRYALADRYWRGVAFSVYKDKRWQTSEEKIVQYWHANSNLTLATDKVHLRVNLYREAVDHPYLLIPDGLLSTHAIPVPLQLKDSGELIFSSPPSKRLKLPLSLAREHQQNHRLRPPNHAESTPSNSEIISQWAQSVTANTTTPHQKLLALEAELSSWVYDLKATIDDKHPIASFITTSKRGHCELFASAMVLAARTLGIPARVVNGYYSGEWNETGGFMLIRQQHAHAWVEAWLEGHWQRFEPTPASRWQMTDIALPRWDDVWESVKMAWYRYVLEFQDDDRFQLWKTIKAQLEEAFLSIVTSTLVLIAIAWMLRQFEFKKHVHNWRCRKNQLTIVDRWLKKHVLIRHPHQPLKQLLPKGVASDAWRKFVQKWEEQCFGTVQTWSRRELRRQLRAISKVD